MLAKLIILFVSTQACTVDTECVAPQACDPDFGVCAADCTGDADCAGAQTCFIAGETGLCVCTGDTDCPNSQSCDTSLGMGLCQPGAGPTCNPACVSPQICDPSSTTCVTPSVPCTQDADCTASQVCNTSATPKTCVTPASCPACTHSQYCGPLTGQCTDCSGVGCFTTSEYCATTGQCVSCSPSCSLFADPPEICTSDGCIPDPCGGECNMNDICGANGQCYDPKCGPGCASILCDQISNTCICAEDTDCPTGKTCDKSTFACVDKSSAAHLYVPVYIAAFLLVFML